MKIDQIIKRQISSTESKLNKKYISKKKFCPK